MQIPTQYLGLRNVHILNDLCYSFCVSCLGNIPLHVCTYVYMHMPKICQFRHVHEEHLIIIMYMLHVYKVSAHVHT